ncbi:restriction endonuclease subunit S [Methanobrevibacter smithii]|uniref:restriction endonuclease subunit S n=1 Tax=Methanobrevibacter smithii TaxID=2173 RepID=UPI0037DC4A8E
MSEEKLVPKLRFSGFTDEWVSYKIGDISKTYSGGTPSTSKREYYEGNIPFIKSGEIGNEVTEQYINEEAINNSSAKKVQKGDLLLALYGATSGEVAISKIDGAINQAVLKIDNKMNNYFQYNYFVKYKDQIIHKYLQGGQGNLSANIIKKLEFYYPNLEEQQKISNYLLLIDNKIELLEKKHHEYQNFKKYLMQQIFAQKLRFADSDSCWKEISLKDIGTFYRGHSYNSTNVADEGLLVLRSNNIQGNVLDFSEDGLQFVDKDCKKELELQKNDIVICMSNGTRRLVGKSAEYTGNYENKVTVGAFCSIFRTKNKLAKYLFQTESYKKNLYLILAGTNINNLKNSDLEKFKFNIPTNESEINKIHDLFVSIDNKIDYNKKQLEEITLFKKGLLQQMFV